MPIPQEAIDSMATGNIKTVSETPAILTNLMLSNAVANQAASQQLTQSISAKAAELLLTTDVSESAGLASLLQMITKTAQTTPPVTP